MQIRQIYTPQNIPGLYSKPQKKHYLIIKLYDDDKGENLNSLRTCGLSKLGTLDLQGCQLHFMQAITQYSSNEENLIVINDRNNYFYFLKNNPAKYYITLDPALIKFIHTENTRFNIEPSPCYSPIIGDYILDITSNRGHTYLRKEITLTITGSRKVIEAWRILENILKEINQTEIYTLLNEYKKICEGDQKKKHKPLPLITSESLEHYVKININPESKQETANVT